MKLIKLVLGLVIILAVAGAIAFAGLGYYLSPQDKLHKADAIVAISGGDTDARTKEAIRLYHAGWAPLVIFSGAASDPTGPSNAAAMRAKAILEGVPADHIILDEAAANTLQNASGVAAIAKSRGLSKLILVTSPYHQRRALISFRRHVGKNITIINHSAPDEHWSAGMWWSGEDNFQLTMTELQKTLFLLWAKDAKPQ